MVRIHDTRRRETVDFVPLDPAGKKVGMYYCGPTVYDSLHLGHARAAIVPDLIRRYLEYRGYVVRWVSNFTDVDDKIIKRAIEEDRDWREITFVYTEEWHRLTLAMGNRPADVFPRATDHIPEMIELVEMLIDRGHAYVASDGDVYFDTASFDGYLSLSGRKSDEQRAGASGRMSEDQLKVKKSPADFILWKVVQNDDELFKAHAERPDRVPSWDSPWGPGRPGWHLECSALSRRYLGVPFDIHGGGQDLTFPHHENELAQNDCGYCDDLAAHDGADTSVRYWVHNGFITTPARNEEERAYEHAEGDDVKMSKSLGNVKWLKDLVWPGGPYDPMAVRMLMVQSHYRSPIRFTLDILDQAQARVERLYSMVERLRDGVSPKSNGDVSEATAAALDTARAGFEQAMDDDFGTPGALAAIDGLIAHGKQLLASDEPTDADRLATAREIVRLASVLGLRAERPGSFGAGSDAAAGDELQDVLGFVAELRAQARSAKDWATADRIRDRLGELGWEIRDGADGQSDVVRKS